MEKMLVTRALNEIKLLNSRIDNAINTAKFVAPAKICEGNISPGKSKEDFMASAKASLQSVENLIERRKRIKAALVISNASTFVEINGVTMSRADAIERKSSIIFEKTLLQVLKGQFGSANSTVSAKNSQMEASIERLVETAFGKESKQRIAADEYDSIAKPYRASNEYGLVDPLDIEALIKKMEADINGFESEVDSALQISNCTSYIEF